MEDRFVSGLLGLSFFKWWFLLIPKVGMTLFVVYVCCMGWMKLGPRKPMPDTARMKAADRAVERIVDNIRQNRGDVRSVALCHFANDASDYFSHRLRERIEKSNVLDLTDFDFAEKLRTLLNVRNRGVANATDALSSIQGEEVDGVLWGSIERFESAKGGGGATLTGEWQLVDKGGAVVCGGAIQREDGESGIVETFTNAIDDLGKSTDGAGPAGMHVRVQVAAWKQGLCRTAFQRIGDVFGNRRMVRRGKRRAVEDPYNGDAGHSAVHRRLHAAASSAGDRGGDASGDSAAKTRCARGEPRVVSESVRRSIHAASIRARFFHERPCRLCLWICLWCNRHGGLRLACHGECEKA